MLLILKPQLYNCPEKMPDATLPRKGRISSSKKSPFEVLAVDVCFSKPGNCCICLPTIDHIMLYILPMGSIDIFIAAFPSTKTFSLWVLPDHRQIWFNSTISYVFDLDMSVDAIDVILSSLSSMLDGLDLLCLERSLQKSPSMVIVSAVMICQKSPTNSSEMVIHSLKNHNKIIQPVISVNDQSQPGLYM